MWQCGDTMMYGRSVCGHRRLMDSSRNLHDPTIHSARRWQGWNVSCVNVANNDITIKQNAIMSCSYDNLHEPVSITVTCNMGWGDPGCLTMRTRTNWAVTIHAFMFSYKLQITSPPFTRQSPPSRTRAVDRDLSCEMRRQFRTLKAALWKSCKSLRPVSGVHSERRSHLSY